MTAETKHKGRFEVICDTYDFDVEANCSTSTAFMRGIDYSIPILDYHETECKFCGRSYINYDGACPHCGAPKGWNW